MEFTIMVTKYFRLQTRSHFEQCVGHWSSENVQLQWNEILRKYINAECALISWGDIETNLHMYSKV